MKNGLFQALTLERLCVMRKIFCGQPMVHNIWLLARNSVYDILNFACTYVILSGLALGQFEVILIASQSETSPQINKRGDFKKSPQIFLPRPFTIFQNFRLRRTILVNFSPVAHHFRQFFACGVMIDANFRVRHTTATCGATFPGAEYHFRVRKT